MGTKIILRNCWIALSVMVLIALPVCIYQLFLHNFEKHVVAWFVAGVFVLLGLPISMFGIILHLNNYTNPEVQRYIIRILWMAPIYAIACWFALVFKGAAIYLDTIREGYEAYVIYSFTFFLIATVEAAQRIEQQQDKPPMHHMPPFCWLPRWELGQDLMAKCKNGVLFYCLVKVLTAGAAFVLEMLDLYGDGDIDFHKGYVYVAFINNCTQVWAMYCLVLFYHVYLEELKPMRPLPKFICIKAVVFFSFWQSVLIAVLVKFGVIQRDLSWTTYDVKDVAAGLQDFLICIEMFIAAVAHVWAFPHDDYKVQVGERPKLSWIEKIQEIFYVRDVGQDMYHHITDVGADVRKGVTEVVTAPVKVVQKILPNKKNTSNSNARSRSEQHSDIDEASSIDLSEGLELGSPAELR